MPISPSLSRWITPTLVGLSYWAAGTITLWLSGGPDGIASIWPPSGILLAALIRWREAGTLRCLLAATVASLLANLTMGTGLSLSLWFTLANIVEAIAGATVWRALTNGRADIADWHDIPRLCGAAVVAATVGSILAFLATGGEDFRFTVSWFCSVTLGMLVVTPVLLVSAGPVAGPQHAGRYSQLREALPALGVVGAVTAATFWPVGYPLLEIPFAVLLAVTWRLRLLGASGGVLIIAIIASFCTALSRGPLAIPQASQFAESLLLQIYLLTLFVTALPLAALLTSREQLARQREESERAHRLLAEASNDIIARFAFDGTPLYVSPASISVLGYTPEEMLHRGSLRDVHHDDQSQLLEVWQQAIAGQPNMCAVYRQRTKNGRTIWLEASYKLVDPLAEGGAREVVAVVRDVTSRRSIELELRRTADALQNTNEMLSTAEAVAGLGHWRFDRRSSEFYWSAGAAQIHDSPDKPRRLIEALSFYHPDDRGRIKCALAEALIEGAPFQLSARIVTADGDFRHVALTGRRMEDENGQISGLFGTMQDITDRIDMELHLEAARLAAVRAAKDAIKLADCDALTGVASRRRILADLEQVRETAHRDGGAFSIIIFDVDHFKRVNDDYGHATGDSVLTAVAEAAAAGLRSGDQIGRIGGEEFLVISTASTPHEAVAQADRLRQLVAEATRKHPQLPPVTASFGVATFGGKVSCAELLRTADEALYAAKAEGRDRVRLAA